jgi:phospholipase A1
MHCFTPSRLLAAPATRPLRAAAAALALIAPAASAQALADCVSETDAVRRLACYDGLFRKTDTRAAPSAPASTNASTASSATAPPVADPTRRALDWPEGLLVSTAFNKAWELTPATKRGTFVVRTYLPNYVLPMHYTSSINATPSSPTHPAEPTQIDYLPVEAKLQVSLRTKVAEGLLLPDADLWLAFTQRSLWQVWNPQESSPFRSTDYQPEAIYVIPVPEKMGKLPGGWQWRMAQLGLAHQSNGQSDPLSRSWNRVYGAVAFDRGEFGLSMRVNHRLPESAAHDDNPDLVHYVGNTEITASWLHGLATSTMTWRTNPGSWKRGSLQMDWTYPVNKAQPAGLRWYAQLFTGYGETLLDYNHYQTTLGLGLTLFQF